MSGGADSLALAFLSKIYSIKNGLVAKFFIVNHKLRAESTKEARLVKQVLRKHSINSEILKWEGKKPKKNIQSLARAKRYELLFKKCNKFRIKNILLGHHIDDLFENFFIRILRGSGLKGLTSFDQKSKVGNINLHRPLLGQKKKDLIFISNDIFNFYIKDPSNNDKKFQRIRVRHLISELQRNGLDKKKLNNTIKNLKYSDNVVNHYVRENFKKNTFFLIEKNRILLNQEFFNQPYEIIFRSFSDSIKIIGKKYYSVRGKKLDKIIEKIPKNKQFKVTLGGCIIEKVNQTVIISKEH